MLTSLRPLGTGTNDDDDELRRVAQTIPYLLTKSRADNTVKTYSQGFKTWKEWSARYKNVESLPAHPYHVMLFIATLIQQSHSYSKIKNIFYAINWIHKMNNLPNPCKNNQVRLMKEAAKRLVSRAKVKKLPIKPYHLLKIARNNRNKKDLKKQRTITMILLGYAGFLRFQELSTLTLGDLIFSEQYVKIFIQKSKCDQYRSGSWVFIAQTGNATCPVRAIKKYIKLAKVSKASEFIFRALTYYKSTNSYQLREKNQPLSYTSVREMILNEIENIGINKKFFGTHSLRAGGATAAATFGVSDRLFKQHGRWSSDKAKDGYVESDLKSLLFVSNNLGI